MKTHLIHRTFTQTMVLIVLSAALVFSVALDTIRVPSEKSEVQTVGSNVETISEANNPANEMRGLLICEEGFRLLLPLNKPTTHAPFQGGIAHNSYTSILLVSNRAIQNHRVLEQQFSLIKLQNLYIPLRI